MIIAVSRLAVMSISDTAMNGIKAAYKKGCKKVSFYASITVSEHA